MKKTFALILAAVFAFAALAMAVSADDTIVDRGTTWKLITPTGVEFESPDGEGLVEAVPQGNVGLDALIDGELVRDATTFTTAGIILIKNVPIAQLAAENNNVAAQDPEEVPSFSFVLNLGKETEFDAVYMAIYHEIATCIAIPGGNEVIVETSKDGRAWTPVGDEGKYYFNSQVGDYIGAGDLGIDECVLPLDEKVSAQYVRLTCTFLPVPEGGYWEYYTNIYEWCGFTELGVAEYQSGRTPKPLTKEQATAGALDITGKWVGEDGDDAVVYEFVDNAGEKTVAITRYDYEDYEANGLSATEKETSTATYTVVASTLTITYSDGSYDEYEVALEGEDGLTMGSGTDAINLTLVVEEPPVPSEPESSDEPVSSEDESSAETSSQEESSEAPGTSTSSTTSTSTSSTNNTTSNTSTPAETDGGFPTWAIVLIVVAVVAIVVVVVIVVVKKKK